MFKKMVGLEAEYLLLEKGEVIIPPAYFERDGFPILGEIRGEPGDTPHKTLANFINAQYKLMDKLSKDQTVIYANCYKVPLKLYKEANKQINYEEKGREIGKVQNVYGKNLDDFSDQIIKGGKIQGINISCGLHIHFSCEEVDTVDVEEAEYEELEIPLNVGITDNFKHSTTMHLYNRIGYKKTKTLTARVSKLNMPTITYMVKKLDDVFFQRFAPPVKERTKFRQSGFFERKPYGFEYRSLPANTEVLNNLPEIVKFSFKLLNEVSN